MQIVETKLVDGVEFVLESYSGKYDPPHQNLTCEFWQIVKPVVLHGIAYRPVMNNGTKGYIKGLWKNNKFSRI